MALRHPGGGMDVPTQSMGSRSKVPGSVIAGCATLIRPTRKQLVAVGRISTAHPAIAHVDRTMGHPITVLLKIGATSVGGSMYFVHQWLIEKHDCPLEPSGRWYSVTITGLLEIADISETSLSVFLVNPFCDCSVIVLATGHESITTVSARMIQYALIRPPPETGYVPITGDG